MGLRIREVPIAYAPRTQREGKKIRWRDGIEAIATLLRWRLVPFRPPRAGTEIAALEEETLAEVRFFTAGTEGTLAGAAFDRGSSSYTKG